MVGESSHDPASDDIWAVWLRHRRHGGDSLTQQAMMEKLRAVRDKVIDHAQLRTDDHLLDVGCGDGLIGFGALSGTAWFWCP